MSISKLRNYFYNLGDKFDSFYRSLIYRSFDMIRQADARDQVSTLDKIPAKAAMNALKHDLKFRGFCNISKERFYSNLSKRTAPFYFKERKKLKAQAARLQLTRFTESISNSTLEKASSLVQSHLGLKHKMLNVATLEEAGAALKLQTSAGFPWMQKKSIAFPDIMEWASNILDPENWDPSLLLKFPTYVAYRVQQRPSDVKLRLIYVYSGVIVVLEQLFLVPLLKHFLGNTNTPYVIGNVGSDLVLRYNYWQSRKNIVSIDWTAFDQSASRLLIMQSFNIIKNSFRLDSFYSAVFDFVSFYFVNTPIVTNIEGEQDAAIVVKYRGVPSGSSFTNLIDTLVNMLVVYCYLIEMGYEINPDLVAFLGDDVILATNADFSLENFSEWASSKFGMEVSLPKSKIYGRNVPVYFLGALIDSKGRYCNPELLLYQICSTTSDLFTKCKTSRDHIVRLWDKACSVCFKYSDGYIVLDAIWPYIEEYLGMSYFSLDYKEIFSRATVPGTDDSQVGQYKNYYTMRTLGWFVQ